MLHKLLRLAHAHVPGAVVATAAGVVDGASSFDHSLRGCVVVSLAPCELSCVKVLMVDVLLTDDRLDLIVVVIFV